MDEPGDGREPEVLKFTLNVTTTDGAAAEKAGGAYGGTFPTRRGRS